MAEGSEGVKAAEYTLTGGVDGLNYNSGRLTSRIEALRLPPTGTFEIVIPQFQSSTLCLPVSFTLIFGLFYRLRQPSTLGSHPSDATLFLLC